MKLKQLAGFTMAATLLIGGTAFAAGETNAAGSSPPTNAAGAGPTNAEYYPFQELVSKTMEQNKNGKVSKQEYMDMMTKAWEMNARKMGINGDTMTTDQFKEVLMYLKAGG